MVSKGEGYRKAPNGSCKICLLPPDTRLEVEARILRGDPWKELERITDASWMTVKRHMDAGHIEVPPDEIREWMQKHGPGIGAIVQRLDNPLEVIDQSPELTEADINNRLLLLERYAMTVLRRAEASEGSVRDITGLIEALRRLTLSLAEFNSLKKQTSTEVIDSEDTQSLRLSILETINARMNGSPVENRPLR